MLIKFIVLSTLITLASSKNDIVEIIMGFPNIIGQLLGMDRTLDIFRANTNGPGYSNSGNLDDSELNSSNEELNGKGNQRAEDTNQKPGDNNMIKISFKGIKDIFAALDTIRRASLSKRSNQVADAVLSNLVDVGKGISETKMGDTLNSLIDLNKKRNEIIKDFNTRFPGLFDGSSLRRIHESRPFVELGPGSIKTEIVTYPPNYLAKRLKHLLKIKKKQAEQNA